MTALARPLELASSELRLVAQADQVGESRCTCSSLFTVIWMSRRCGRCSPRSSTRRTSATAHHAPRATLTLITMRDPVRRAGRSWFVTASRWPGSARRAIVLSHGAFAFARIPFRGKRPLYLLVLIGIMVPFEAVLIPVYMLFADVHLHNTWWALIAPDIASPLALFLLTQFFQEIPKELDEAAYLDGAGRFTVYRLIILPLATPILATLATHLLGLGTSTCGRSYRHRRARYDPSPLKLLRHSPPGRNLGLRWLRLVWGIPISSSTSSSSAASWPGFGSRALQVAAPYRRGIVIAQKPPDILGVV